jgi:hypothetical protein
MLTLSCLESWKVLRVSNVKYTFPFSVYPDSSIVVYVYIVSNSFYNVLIVNLWTLSW